MLHREVVHSKYLSALSGCVGALQIEKGKGGSKRFNEKYYTPDVCPPLPFVMVNCRQGGQKVGSSNLARVVYSRYLSALYVRDGALQIERGKGGRK
jgi:hypothetical protein